MRRKRVQEAIDLLGKQFPLYDWTYRDVPGTGGSEVRFEWYGGEDEDLMVCAHASLSGLAHRLGYHPNYLSGLVRKECGKTFSQLLLELRMDRAQTLLARTTLSVEEVATTVGYSSTSNFYRAYRDYFGHSPRQGRRARAQAEAL